MSRALCFLTMLVLPCVIALPVQAKLKPGQTPQFTARTMAGQQFTQDAFTGRVTVVEFWATWCGPCVEQVPHLRKTFKKYRDQGLSMISVNLDKSQRKAEQFIEKHRMVWSHVHDKSQRRALAKQWGVSGIPHAFIFGPEGKLTWRGHPGSMDRPLKKAIKNLKKRAKKAKRKNNKKNKTDGDQPIDEKQVGEEAAPEAGDQPRSEDEASAESLQKGNRALIRARSLLGKRSSNAAKALATLTTVEPASLVDPKLRPAAERLIERLKRFAAARPEALEKAKQASPEGAERLTHIKEALASGGYYRTLPPAVRKRRLESAKQLDERGNDIRAYDKYQTLVKRAAGTPVGQTAQKRIQSYEADKTFMRRLKEKRRERKAKRLLGLARNYAQAGRNELAIDKYEQLMDQYPDTDQAQRAEAALSRLN